MLACTGRECGAPDDRPQYAVNHQSLPVNSTHSPNSPRGEHGHSAHSPNSNPDALKEMDKHIRTLQKDLGLVTRKLEAVEADLQKLESADELNVLKQQLEAVRVSLRREKNDTQNHFEERLQALELSSARTAEILPASKISGQLSELAPRSSVLALEDRLERLEKAEEHLAAAVEAHDQELSGLDIDRKDTGANAATHLQHAQVLRINEEQTQKYDVIFEELAEHRKWRTNVDARLDQQEENLAKGEEMYQDLQAKHHSGHLQPHHSGHHSGSPRSEDKVETFIQQDLDTGHSGIDILIGSLVQEYNFAESVYDAAFFIGQPYLSISGNFLIAFGFLLNLAMQFGVIYILVSVDEFKTHPFDELAKNRFRMWRYSEGHAVDNADRLTDVSLVSRVCGDDPGLPGSATQKDNNDMVDTYLSDDRGQFLCNVAVVLWVFCVALEYRKILDFVMGLIVAPSAPRSKIYASPDGALRFEAISCLHKAVGFSVSALRLAVAILLMYFGSQWLAYTESITDLLLNASALGFVLDIDETIFGVAMTARVVGFIACMSPLPLHKSILMDLIPFILPTFAIVFTFIFNFTHVKVLTESMGEVSAILCGENTEFNFIAEVDALGFMLYTTTKPYTLEDTSSGASRAMIEATRLLVERHADAELYAEKVADESGDLHAGMVEFKARLSYSVDDMVKDAVCADLRWGQQPGDEPGDERSPDQSPDPRLGSRLYVATGNESLRSVTSCSQVASWCRLSPHDSTAKRVRYLCPRTCGCADPLSGMWNLASYESGCPSPNCLSFAQSQLDNDWNLYPCADRNLTDLINGGVWAQLINQMVQRHSINRSVADNLTQQGCDAIWLLSEAEQALLCQNEEPVSYIGMAPWCPLTCNCWKTDINEIADYARDGLCPTASCYFAANLFWTEKCLEPITGPVTPLTTFPACQQHCLYSSRAAEFAELCVTQRAQQMENKVGAGGAGAGVQSGDTTSGDSGDGAAPNPASSAPNPSPAAAGNQSDGSQGEGAPAPNPSPASGTGGAPGAATNPSGPASNPSHADGGNETSDGGNETLNAGMSTTTTTIKTKSKTTTITTTFGPAAAPASGPAPPSGAAPAPAQPSGAAPPAESSGGAPAAAPAPPSGAGQQPSAAPAPT